MNSFKSPAVSQHISLTNSNVYSQAPFYLRAGDDSSRNGAHVADLGELEQSPGNGFHHLDSLNLTTSSTYNGNIKASNASVASSNLHFGGITNIVGSTEMGGGGERGQQFLLQKSSGIVGFASSSSGNGHFENWEDSEVVAEHHSQQTDTSTDTDVRNQFTAERLIGVEPMNQGKARSGDQKALCRLAQNREAARKSRMRKKAYVQQLENSRVRLAQLEQDLKRARHQGTFAASGDQSHYMSGNGPMAFDSDYGQWQDEHQRLINDLRSAVNSHVGDTELQLLLDGVMSHYDEVFRLKSSGAKSDIFHILSGMWKTPAERFLMWLGGFRSSDVLKVLGNQIEPLTDQQLMGICNLQHSSQQAEDALSQGMEALQQSLVETLSRNSIGSRGSGNVDDYMGQMAIAMSKLATLENFLHQADLLRLQTLQQLQRILTPRQAARALLAINDYKSRLRALSSLWLARPKD